ncbi:ATP-dependent helicase [Candidatus Saccharibacteria bacterium]|nr:ATP-dependent helicase [Candidatus Saccharibacteria bacterium]MBI3338001.1 ATP-dependent helicase [Candidatus Saccharibacteria bacterium]
MDNSIAAYERFNDAQRAAITAEKGPILVVAGAGTGKTSVIVERINRLIEKGVPTKRLLALTFTEKAATEMLDRVNASRGLYELELPIMTFNAYGESLLRRYAADIGLGRNFIVLGQSAQIVFLGERVDALGLEYFAPLARPDSLISDLAAYFSQLKQQIITPETHNQYVENMPTSQPEEKLNKIKYQELAKAYEAYIRLCREANVIDYDDQIYLLIELLRKRSNVLKEVQDSYDYVMVDEFQDTNTMQSVLVDLIAAPRKNLFVVGDDDQSIYGWRGATLANILEFKDRYPAAKEIALTQNYRSTKEILASAYRLIQHNNPHRLEVRLNIDKQLVSDRSGEPPRAYKFTTLDEELTWIANDVKRRLNAGASPGSIAIMARRNTTIQLLHEHLDYLDIEHAVTGQRYELYKDPSVRMLLESIKTVVDPHNNTSLYHTLLGPLFSIPASTLSGLNAVTKNQHESLLDNITNSEEPELAEARSAIELIKIWHEKIGITTVGQLAYAILDDSGYKDRLYKISEEDASSAIVASRLGQFFAVMKEFEQIALVPSAIQFIETLPALQAAGEGGEDNTMDLANQFVNILTIHKAKGLEWPIVYVADCSEESFPLRENLRGIILPEKLLDSREAPHHQAKLDLRKIARSQGKSARADSSLTEGEVAIATSREYRPLPAEMNWSGDGGALRKSSKSSKDTSQESEANTHMAEERRLMYVAMTRARNELILTYSEHHSSSTIRKPSRFLTEALDLQDFSSPATANKAAFHAIDLHGNKPLQSLRVPNNILNNGHVHLSVSQAQKYLDCPLDFYYCYILNIPKEPSPALRYGSIMHGLVEEINLGLIAGKLPSLTELINQLETQWPKAGYASLRHRERSLTQAHSTLKRLYAQATKEQRIPIAVEKPFSFTVKDINLSITGRFDAILPSESGGIEIVDYKTMSSVDTIQKAKLRASSSQQLAIYALAWQISHGELPKFVTLDFIDRGVSGSVKKTQRGIDGTYLKLQRIADGIRAMDFPPGKDHRFCQHPLI